MINSDTVYKIVFLDIETSPNLAFVWGAWEQDVIAFKTEWYLLSFSQKQPKGKTITYALPDFPLYKKEPENDLELAKRLWDVLDGADLIVGHNIDKFDIRKMNTRFLVHGLPPPSPYKTCDTLKLSKHGPLRCY